MLPIVDTHQHLWDLDLFHLPWAASSPVLNRSYRTADYLAATAGLNVVKAVYMEVDVTPEQQAAEAEFIIDLCQQADGTGCIAGAAADLCDRSLTYEGRTKQRHDVLRTRSDPKRESAALRCRRGGRSQHDHRNLRVVGIARGSLGSFRVESRDEDRSAIAGEAG